MNLISKFGITLFSGSSVLVFILKAMTDRNWAVNTSFYAFLNAFAVSITMILPVYVKSIIILIIIFASALAVSFVAIAPIFLGAV